MSVYYIFVPSVEGEHAKKKGGGKVKCLVSGGSKLPIYLDDFFEMAGTRFTCFTRTKVQILTLEVLFEMAGIPIVVGYGLTETRWQYLYFWCLYLYFCTRKGSKLSIKY